MIKIILCWLVALYSISLSKTVEYISSEENYVKISRISKIVDCHSLNGTESYKVVIIDNGMTPDVNSRYELYIVYNNYSEFANEFLCFKISSTISNVHNIRHINNELEITTIEFPQENSENIKKVTRKIPYILFDKRLKSNASMSYPIVVQAKIKITKI